MLELLFGTGEFNIGLLDLTRPTIIRGVGGTTLVGTIVDRTGVPLLLEGLTLADAPYPGALLISHPMADVTLLDVTVIGATGFGILANGGRFEARNSRVERTHAPSEEDPLPDALQGLFGPPAGSDTLPGLVRFPGRHKLGISMAAHASGLLETGGSGWMTRLRDVLRATGVFNPIQFLDMTCLGSGLVLSSGAYSELHDVSLAFNEGAGIAVRGGGTFVGAFGLGTAANGFAPSGGTLADGGCFGGITVRDDATLVTQGTGSSLNFGVGVLVASGGVAMLFDLLVTHTLEHELPDECDACAHNVLVFLGSYVSLKDFQLDNGQAGLLLADHAQANAADGVITENEVGLASSNYSEYFLSSVDITGNGQNILTDGSLPIPNEPLPVPPSP